MLDQRQSKSHLEKRKKVEQKKPTVRKNESQRDTEVKVAKDIPYDDFNWYPDQKLF